MKTFIIKTLGLIPPERRIVFIVLIASGAALALFDAFILFFVPNLLSADAGFIRFLGHELKTWHALVILGMLLALKNLLFIAFQIVKHNYLADLQVYFSQKVLTSNVLGENRNDQDIGSSISATIVESLQLILNVYNPIINLIVEGSLGVIIFLTLLWLNPLESAMLGAGVLVIVLGFQHYVKTKNHTWGIVRAAADAERSEWVRAAMVGAEEISVMGRFKFVLDRFTVSTKTSSKMVANKSVTIDISKNIVELSVLISVGGVVLLSFIALQRSTSELIILLTTFAFSAYRLMPSINRIMVSLQSIRYGYGSFLRVASDIEIPFNVFDKPSKIAVSSLGISGCDLQIAGHKVKDFSCNLNIGDILIVKGESGVGKSTLLRSILYGAQGLLIKINDQPLSGGLCRNGVSVAYMVQSSSVMPVNLYTNIALSNEPLKPDTVQLLNSIKLSDLAEKEKLEHEKLSGGQRSRISFLRVVEFGASIILLDEPTSALDSELKSKISSIVRSLAKNSIVIIVSHDDAFDSIASNLLEMMKQ